MLGQFQQAFAQLPPAKQIMVAFSGGLDSSVLLHLLSQLTPSVSQQVTLLHVNHRLQSCADDWLQHCRQVADHYQVNFHPLTVEHAYQQGESVEQQARDFRYALFKPFIKQDCLLLTAHHADDQAETMLLQLLRGAGIKGLAAMPMLKPFSDGLHARPLLSFTRQQLADYAKQHQLLFIDDPSNDDLRFDRNYLRHRVLPLIGERWPSYQKTINRSAKHCADVQDWIDQVSEKNSVEQPSLPATLPLSVFDSLSATAANYQLRAWLQQLNVALPPQHKLQQIFSELMAAKDDANPIIAWQDVQMRRYQQHLYCLNTLPELDADWYADWDCRSVLRLPAQLGELHAMGHLPHGVHCRIAFRQGGELCFLANKTHHQSLKKLMQDWQIPPWLRSRIPLVYLNQQLAAVIGYAIMQPYHAGSETQSLKIIWRQGEKDEVVTQLFVANTLIDQPS